VTEKKKCKGVIMARNYWGGFSYVSKAEKMQRAEKAKAELRKKKGLKIEPVVLEGKAMARTWWGKSWNQNLERYADYYNRIGRGRTYVRQGAVLDLKIAEGSITALVSGSRRTPYRIAITIKTLVPRHAKALMEKSRAAIDSMSALLAGEFSPELQQAFFQQQGGLFPTSREIEFSCSCPDWAAMCKHVAAALYGTAVRLDEKPELFFLLRGIKIDNFVSEMVLRESTAMLQRAEKKSERIINGGSTDLSKLFGIRMDEVPIVGKVKTPLSRGKGPTVRKQPARNKKKSDRSPKKRRS
jgi:uncharacterized Zn finger protein